MFLANYCNPLWTNMDRVDTMEIANDKEPLIPKNGGFRKLKSFQIAQLSYDVTVRFCDKYVEKRSRTHDQMVQAARSGVQNIAEGSLASATSKKTELKLTNVARASLGELKLDFEDFLRHRNLALWDKEDPLRAELIARRCKTADEVAEWVREVHERCKRDGQNGKENSSRDSTTSIPSTKSIKTNTYPEIAANAALVLISIAISLLDRQIKYQADKFEDEGGFTERLYRIRKDRRDNS